METHKQRRALEDRLRGLHHHEHGEAAVFHIEAVNPIYTINWVLGPSEDQVIDLVDSYLEGISQSGTAYSLHRSLTWNKVGFGQPLVGGFVWAYMRHHGLSFDTMAVEYLTLDREPAFETADVQRVLGHGVMADLNTVLCSTFESDDFVECVLFDDVASYIEENISAKSVGWVQGEYALSAEPNAFAEKAELVDLSDPETAVAQRAAILAYDDAQEAQRIDREWTVKRMSAKDMKYFLTLRSDATRRRYLERKFGDAAQQILK